MGQNFWGSNHQESFLFRYKKDYLKARRCKKTRQFWPRFFSHWFSLFTEDRLIKKTRMTQCKTWMGNHTGSREDGREYDEAQDDAPPPVPPPPLPPSAPRTLNRRERPRLRKASRDSKIMALIRGRPKKYMLPAYQAYSHLYFDKVESTIEASWKNHLEIVRGRKSSYEQLSIAELAEIAKDEHLTVVNKELRRLYLLETDEIKEEVQVYRQRYAMGFKSMSEMGRRVNALKNTTSLMKSLLPSLYHETGMIVTVLAAGRSPLSGNIVFRSYHVGKGEFGENFAQCYMKWDEKVKGEYVKYFGVVEKAAFASGAANSLVSSSVGKCVLLEPRSEGKSEDGAEDSQTYEEFGGLGDTEHAEKDTVAETDNAAEMEEDLSKGSKRGAVNWDALFKANRILSEVDEEHMDFGHIPPPSDPCITNQIN